MIKSLFVTGATGLVGTALLRRIADGGRFQRVVCLTRDPARFAARWSGDGPFCCVKGDLFDTQQYRPYLAHCDTLIHLATATGKVRPQEYFRVNAEGTACLLRQCEELGVSRFLHVSSIAAKFSKTPRYYYGQSKRQAETAVQQSGLRSCIIRPTIVIAKDSPTWKSLAKLARRPFCPMFGDGSTKIQPVYVEDLVDCILSILDDDRFDGAIYELGGPEVIAVEEFVKRVFRLRYRREPRVVHVSLQRLLPLWSFLEDWLYPVLPFTVGQLSSFAEDGTAEPNELFARHAPHMKSVDEMSALAAGTAASHAGLATAMTDPVPNSLEV